MHALQSLVHKHDYSAYGGAPLLGIDGICIICHGSRAATGRSRTLWASPPSTRNLA